MDQLLVVCGFFRPWPVGDSFLVFVDEVRARVASERPRREAFEIGGCVIVVPPLARPTIEVDVSFKRRFPLELGQSLV